MVIAARSGILVLVLVAGLLTIVGVAVLQCDQGPSSPPVEPSPGTEPATQTQSSREPAEGSALTRIEFGAAEREELEQARAELQASPELIVDGMLNGMEPEDQREDLRLALIWKKYPGVDSDRGDHAVAQVARDGRFRLRVPTTQWSVGRPYPVRVELGGRPLFVGMAVLDRYIEIDISSTRPNRELRGRVILDGSPCAGCGVGLYLPSALSETGYDRICMGPADGQGRFELSCRLPEGDGDAVLLVKRGPQFFRIAGTLAEFFGQGEEVEIELSTDRVELLVRDRAGKALGSATAAAQVYPVEGPPWQVSARAGADGLLVLQGSPGRYQICVAAAGYSAEVIETTLGHGVVRRIDVTLAESSESSDVFGVVVDESNRPVPGVDVLLFPKVESLDMGAAAVQRTIVGSDGRFRLPSPTQDGYSALLVRHPFDPAYFARIDGMLAGSEQVVVLPEAGTVEVRIACLGGFLPAFPNEIPFSVTRLEDGPEERRTMNQGYTRLSLRAGSHRLCVTTPDRAAFGTTVIDVLPNQKLLCDVWLLPTRIVGGVVLSDGRPVVGARVQAVVRSRGGFGDVFADWFSAQSDEEGRFSLRCPDVPQLALRAAKGPASAEAPLQSQDDYILELR